MSMPIEEYDNQMRIYSDQLRNSTDQEWEDLYEKVSKFQHKHMTEYLEELQKITEEETDEVTKEAREAVCELLEYAINDSESGSAIVYEISEEVANKFDEIYEDMIGEFLLDAIEIYKEDDGYVLDAMFGGNYVPYWDGWND